MVWTRKQAIKNISFLAFSQYFTAALFFLRGFLFAKFLGPVSFGIYASIYLIYSYGIYSQLGTLDCLGVVVPSLSTTTTDQKSRNTLFSSFTWLNIFSILFTVTIFIYSTLTSTQIFHDFSSSLILCCIAMIFYQNYRFFSIILSLKQEFKKLAIIQFLHTFFEISLSLILLFTIGFNGIFIGIIINSLVFSLILSKGNLIFIGINVNIKQLKDSLKVGFPLLLVGFSFAILITLDKLVIAKYFEKGLMGYYSIAVSLSMIPYMLSSTINSVVSRRMIDEISANQNSEKLKVFFRESILILAFLLPLVSILIITFAEPFVVLFLPKYVVSLNPTCRKHPEKSVNVGVERGKNR